MTSQSTAAPRTPYSVDPQILEVVREAAAQVREVSGQRIGDMVERALLRTLTDTITLGEDGSAFVITGDIPAMWLRDSTTQLTPYLRLLEGCAPLADLVAAVVRRQFACLSHDTYANAFNDGPTGGHHEPRDLCTDPHVWEQKYEIDSLAYPVVLAHGIWRATGRTDVLEGPVHEVLARIVAQLRREQRHEDSSYRFVRPSPLPTESLTREGRGTPTAFTGMTWSGFRPSDDACTFHYNIPGNLLAAQALRGIAEIAEEALADAALAADARALSQELVDGVAQHGVVGGPAGERIYAYEVDGLGGTLLMDDANTPSLLALPLFAPDVMDAPVWEATRRFILSPANPFYVEGTVASGVGSPHTLPGYVWPIALAIEALTGAPEERPRTLELIAATDAGTGNIHESFHASDPTKFSRPWFSWADSMFCELALQVVEDAQAARR
ncbi:glycoside hydrolase family 125 protein [Brachybacterium phenoliresistens]|uniref:Glycosyl hydrolase n=1 Tax=Brachybacterium phenoliresistens TaxID=396014 RepID=Z9JTK1_9MICO|nr:glycoside hydrolase family 125 protein [Brachybacterium phenoliresistens]EWS81126.1 glycosyl hydrolase [Brachybacterium phenoliresistens]